MLKTARNAIYKLDAHMSSYKCNQDPKITNDMVQYLVTLFYFINNTSLKKRKDVEKINEMIFKENLVSKMITLMGKCDQVINNAISGLLQATVLRFPDFSLPSYFKKHSKDLKKLCSYFSVIEIGSTAHIIFRACISRSRDFAKYIFKKAYVISFFQYLVNDHFDLIGPAFATYSILLNTYIDISAEHVASNWDIYHYQFKIILHSGNYIILAYFLGILYKFLSATDCKQNMLKFIDDPENLMIVLKLLKDPKRRLSVGAYNLFKLFAINARRSMFTTSVIRNNKKLLLSILEDYLIPDVPNIQEQLEQEHEQLIDVIKSIK
ncbi:calcium-binding protein 39-like protein [Tritrichomonas foetus]|uniref:Calcium-binding protein 39-like protein n=1 Tax=Tritrichomonas foetus TaxID=1144522 RepID=A0A1J4JRZ5_9EUKA|nr:calcium-binding protein 39-like protein [Tritrichomonas foetus]|eukprot:OHT01811.1 calcium-binding protein 39-like protein [Tritrichomonas foetus]